MTSNQFGRIFSFTSWGESHGPAIGGVVDGMPPNILLSEEDIQPWLDRRRPGTSRFTTQRRESDTVKILSGVFNGKTTGAPIGFMIENTDQRSKDYSDIAKSYRPGHADYTYMAKYGIRDYRGGGRSSARETAIRVAAGAIAYKMLQNQEHGLGNDIWIKGAITQIGEKKINHDHWDWQEINNNDFFSPDAQSVSEFADYIDSLRKSGNSVGAIIEVQAHGIPAGFGAPIYDKLDSDLAKAMMSINAVKGVEIGDGMASAMATGDMFGDNMRVNNTKNNDKTTDYYSNPIPLFSSNHAGGILGGISTGQPIIVRFAIKPTSSILQKKNSINQDGENIDIMTTGRHDPCVGIRAVPVGEAMMALVLADHFLQQRAQCGDIYK